MPESVPGPKSFSGASGRPSPASLRFATLDLGSQIAFSWSTVRQSTARFLFVTTAMPSLAIWTSSYLMPAFSQTGASSSSLIGREASEMSVSPAQNFSKPPPVPD